jgi:MscS family membrane protein
LCGPPEEACVLSRTSWALVAALCVLATPAWAQLANKNSARENPREALKAFLKAAEAGAAGDQEALANAIEGLDLSHLPAAMRTAAGPLAAMNLYDLLDGVKLPAYEAISDEPKGPAVVLYESPSGRGRVALARIRGQWRFDAETVGGVSVMLDEVRYKQRVQEARVQEQAAEKTYESVAEWLRAHQPDYMLGRAFLLEFWQWAGLLLLLLVGVFLDRLVTAFLLFAILRALKRQGIEVDKEVTRGSLRPLGFLVMAGFWWLGLGWLGLNPQVLKVVATAVKFITAAAGVWCAYRLVDVGCSALEKRSLRTESKFDDLLVPLVRKSGKVFVFGFGVVFIADTLDFSISSLLAGLGLGGLAFALAAQDTVGFALSTIRSSPSPTPSCSRPPSTTWARAATGAG